MSQSALSHKISVQLLEDIHSGLIAGGEHLAAQQVAERYGVSRTPVREALGQLEQKGVLHRHRNRGFFVAETMPDDVRRLLEEQQDLMSDDYQMMADDWLTDRLPEEVTELFLRQKYSWTKAKVADILMRAVREGWAERKDGYGWRLLPVTKTPAAFDALYRFRMSIEPAAMLEPTFQIDRKILDHQKRVQSAMLENGIEGTPKEQLLRNGADFHEAIISLSNNPFFITALQRVNRMRRLMEYRVKVDWDRIQAQSTEHLEMIAMLEKGEIAEASYFMRRHLNGALERKSPIAHDWLAASKG